MAKAVIISGVPPYLLKTADNPEGMDGSVFSGIRKSDRCRSVRSSANFSKTSSTRIFTSESASASRQCRRASTWPPIASATASLACVPTWYEDFRQDVAKIDVPTLVIQGDADRIVPFASSGQRTAKMVKGAELVVIKDGPHNIAWTHADEVNAALTQFLAKGAAKGVEEKKKKPLFCCPGTGRIAN